MGAKRPKSLVFLYFILLKGLYGAFPDEKSMFAKEDIPEDFLEAVRKSSDLFLQLQVKLFKFLIFNFRNWILSDCQRIKECNNCVAN